MPPLGQKQQQTLGYYPTLFLMPTRMPTRNRLGLQ